MQQTISGGTSAQPVRFAIVAKSLWVSEVPNLGQSADRVVLAFPRRDLRDLAEQDRVRGQTQFLTHRSWHHRRRLETAQIDAYVDPVGYGSSETLVEVCRRALGDSHYVSCLRRN